ncbi:DUF1499 domain-containing protein [Craterilacuibacter sp. RT1T]|uniref:DUF1499 domain-containing protein n=1 Tax=Craterilacuibacter sp. RT1T TaxID=2942211 RepID=UPI0020C0302D|nr:DUF1499 domain-containing protein [Craterilacuibacter sp. RT1T]MCL6262890.1 DUF1499 domain-containing protein [Craterilacuibacter sp. RT1T]
MYGKLWLVLATLGLGACAGTPPAHLGVKDGRLAPCPASPNCVSSQAPASDVQHAIAALELRRADLPWPQIVDVVGSLPRTRIVKQEEGYLHAESRSAWLGFVDDVELYRPANSQWLALRSASRLGYSDLGVNRARMQALRESMAKAGLLAD